jgi:CBS domain-containing protein
MNTISQRIADFLKEFPPFEALTKDDLIKVSASVEVIHLEENETLFAIDDEVSDCFYVVKDGAVGLYRSEGVLVDECDEGDIFGLRALLRQGKYLLEATALEESIIYSISSQSWESYIAINQKASTFVMTSLASNSTNHKTPKESSHLIQNKAFEQLQTAEYSKNPITTSINTSIREAATIMTDKKVGSIVITENLKPIGIITDKDLRTKVATGHTSIESDVTQIMSSPVLTFPENITVAEAQLAMLRHKITHLCITKDGTSKSRLTGILSEHDIIVLREMTAASLVKEVKRSRTTEELRIIRVKAENLLEKNLQQNIPIEYLGKLLSAINDSICTKIISNTLETVDTPPCKFAWLSIGSQGRREQLLMTDQDNALVFEDVASTDLEKTRSYFLKLSALINKNLAEVGFEFCPAEMMASNPKWCQSLSEWTATFNNWITQPNQEKLMLCTIFFDFELVYGNQQLVNVLGESIFEAVDSYDIFLNYLGRDALQNPAPLSFFRQFLVEESGKHKDQFDIKARAIMPLVDAARLLILSHNVSGVNNTLERYNKLTELEPQNQEIYQFCAESFKNLLRFRTQQGLLNKDSGRFITIQELDKLERLKLKRSFKAIKQIQELIQTRFKLSQIM